jgi:hypothetical protein
MLVNALPVATAGNNGPLCNGFPLNLTSGGGTGYSWGGPNSFLSLLQNPTILSALPVASGIYTVTVTDSNGCSNTATTSVTVNAALNVQASYNGPLCAGDSLNLGVNNIGTGYSWSGPSGYSSTQQNPTITPSTVSNSGTYIVTATNAGGCTGTSSITVTVNPSPTATAVNNGPVCQGDPVNLTGGGGTNYSWTGPGSYSSTQQNPVIPAGTAVAGVYNVTVTDPNGCSSTAATTLVVNALPVVSMSANSPVCDGSNLSMNVTGGNSFSWSGPNGFSGSAQSPVINGAQVDDSGWYSVEATDANGCSNKDSMLLVVNPAPTASFDYSVNCFQSDAFQSTSTGGTSPLATDWDVDGDGNTDYSTPDFSHTFTDTANQQVTLTVTDANGCVSIITQNVAVKGGVQKPNMPNMMKLTSTIGNDKLDFQVFAPGFNECIEYNLYIYNRWGIRVYAVENLLSAPDLNCSNCFQGRTETGEVLSPGTYYYVLEGSSDISLNGTITIFD